MRVLITSAGTATSVGLIKSFRRHAPGTRIIATDVNPYGLTSGSLLADGFRRVRYAAEPGYVDELAGIVESEGIDLLIPVNDAEVDAVAASRARIPERCVCLVPSHESVWLCRHKLEATRYASSLGIPCPELLGVGSGGPRICRENVSVGSRGVRAFGDGEPLSEEAEEGLAVGRSFLQRMVVGSEFTVDVLSDACGRPAYAVPRERLEVKSGVATKAAVTFDGEMIDYATRLARALRLPGFSNVQFIRPSDGPARFIEVNPRFGGCSVASLLAAPGMFPAFLEMARGGAVGQRRLNEGVAWGGVVTRYYEEVLYAR